MRPPVLGLDVDRRTGCAHWRSSSDVIAIRMFCCQRYYACKDCHEALADHPARPWPRRLWLEPAVLCGVCATELTIQAYLDAGYACPGCGAAFNPACRHHYGAYFEDAGRL